MLNDTQLSMIKRGMIVKVRNQYQNPNGHVITGDRPAVVISNNKGNEYSPVIIVAYMTTSLKRLEMKTHVLLQHYDELLLSVVKTEQIDTVDKDDVLEIITEIRTEDMVRIDAAIRVSLGLEVS